MFRVVLYYHIMHSSYVSSSWPVGVRGGGALLDGGVGGVRAREPNIASKKFVEFSLETFRT